MLLASFFDLANDGIDAGDLSVLATGVAAFCAAVAGIYYAGRWVGAKYRARKAHCLQWLRAEIRGIVRQEVSEATKSIQPNANGGKSLPDANKKIDLLLEHLGVEVPESLKVKPLPTENK